MSALGQLGSWARQHRTVLLGGGVAAAAGVAFLARRRGDVAPAAAGVAAYDSTANDVYSSIQPQIEHLARGVTETASTLDDRLDRLAAAHETSRRQQLAAIIKLQNQNKAQGQTIARQQRQIRSIQAGHKPAAKPKPKAKPVKR